jgi:hypothetical protein
MEMKEYIENLARINFLVLGSNGPLKCTVKSLPQRFVLCPMLVHLTVRGLYMCFLEGKKEEGVL